MPLYHSRALDSWQVMSLLTKSSQGLKRKKAKRIESWYTSVKYSFVEYEMSIWTRLSWNVFFIVQHYSECVCEYCWCGGTHPDGDKWLSFLDLKVVHEYDTNHSIVWDHLGLFHSNEQAAVNRQRWLVLLIILLFPMLHLRVSLKTWRDVLQ